MHGEFASADLAFFKDALIVLAAAAVVVPLFHRLRLSPVLGFLLVGLAVGPHGAGMLASRLPWLGFASIASPGAIAPIARLGVALLLFMIGLELSFERLWRMRRLVFGLGGAQVALSALGVDFAARAAFGLGGAAAAVLGIAFAMSSTAVVMAVLSAEKRLPTPAGRAAFAMLLFQDLAAVPALFVLGALRPGGPGGWDGLWPVLAQAVAAVALLVGLGRLALRPLFRGVARMQSADVFVAASLLVVMASGLATAAAGLSMPLGALIGGLLLAGTEYRRQVEVTIEPFRGLFLGVFLLSTGMGLDPALLFAHPAPVLALAGLAAAIKLALIAPFARLFGISWAAGIEAGLLLGPGGEFGFVLLGIGAAEGLLAQGEADLARLATALGMAAIPLLALPGRALAHRRAPAAPAAPAASEEAAPRVLIAGFGRVGRTVGAMLVRHGVSFLAIDRDPDRVAAERKRGQPVHYGDMTRPELLRRLHLETARALVVTLDDPGVADTLVALARRMRPDLLIVARARDSAHAAHLYRTGASDAVPETVEASLQLSEAVLVDLGVPMGPVIASIHEKRAEFQEAIRAMAPEAEIRSLGRHRLRDALRRGGGGAAPD